MEAESQSLRSPEGRSDNQWIVPKRPSVVKSILFSWRRSPIAVFAVLAFVTLVLMSLMAPIIATQDPAAISLLDRLKPPGYIDKTGQINILGTDHLGRDIFSRLVYGSRISLLVGITSVLIGGGLGCILGILSGFYGGTLDDVIMRLAEVQLAFPSILLFIAVLVVLGPGLGKLIGVLGFTSWVTYARVLRGEVLSIREREFVESAKAIGCSDLHIMIRHIVPNAFAPILIVASFAVATAIIAEASLSFLGLGVPASIPTWGSMLAEAREYIRDAWWPVTFPGLAIMMAVLSINVIGDWLRDYLDPRLKL